MIAALGGGCEYNVCTAGEGSERCEPEGDASSSPDAGDAGPIATDAAGDRPDAFVGPLTCTPGPLRSLSLGERHTCVVLADGTPPCWGDNTDGQLGDGTTTSSSVPRPVTRIGIPQLDQLDRIAAGGRHTCALSSPDDEGSVYGTCWGGVEDHATVHEANFDESDSDPSPTTAQLLVRDLDPWNLIAIDTGATASGAVDLDGAPLDWGTYPTVGLQYGPHQPSNPELEPWAQGFFVDVATGTDHQCYLQRDGGVSCFGGNDFGQIGIRPVVDANRATLIEGLTGVQVLAAGAYHNCVIAAAGAVSCWGSTRTDSSDSRSTRRSPRSPPRSRCRAPRSRSRQAIPLPARSTTSTTSTAGARTKTDSSVSRRARR